MYNRIDTKAKRLEFQNYNFENLVNDGFEKEVYNELVIFTKVDARGRFIYKIFKGTATKPTHNFYVTTLERRNDEISKVKKNYDSSLEWKAQRKAENKKSSHASCASAIRTELKKCFSNIKFSVTSESFSMGDAVRISWENGPTEKMVDAIVKKYQSGHYNSMEDMYEYSNTNADIPQSKYVQTSRKISADVMTVVNNEIEKLHSDFLGFEKQTMCHQILSASALPVGCEVVGLEFKNSDHENGRFESGYVLKFEGVESQAESLSKIAAEISENENFEVVAVAPGEVQIVDYSEKAFAVVGETKTIKDDLKKLGGKFNPRLTCGAGWIFSKRELEAVTKYLQGDDEAENENENGNDAQNDEIQFLQIEAPETTTLTQEVKKTVQMIAELDLQTYGQIQPGAYQAAAVQNIDLFTEIPPEFEGLAHLAQYEKTVKVINLFGVPQSKNFNC